MNRFLDTSLNFITLDKPRALALRRAEGALHRAADANVAKLSVAIRYAFAMGRKAARSRSLGVSLEDRVSNAIRQALEATLPKTLQKIMAKGGRIAGQELRTLGGAGSGNFGHSGRPGEVGGSSSTITSSIGHIAYDGSIQTVDFTGSGTEIKNPRGEVVGKLSEADQKEHKELWPGRMGMPQQRFRMQAVNGIPGYRIQWLQEPSADDFFKVQDYYEDRGVKIVAQFVSGTGLRSIDPQKLRTAKGKPKTIGPIKFHFDDQNPRAARWAREHTGWLIDGITKVTRERIQEAVATAQEDGDLPAQYESILDAIGDEDRAEMIARTESMTAVNAGQREAWDQAVDEGLLPPDTRKVWIATGDEGVCPICEELDGTETDLDGEYPGLGEAGPPAHPNCRCTEGIV